MLIGTVAEANGVSPKNRGPVFTNIGAGAAQARAVVYFVTRIVRAKLGGEPAGTGARIEETEQVQDCAFVGPGVANFHADEEDGGADLGTTVTDFVRLGDLVIRETERRIRPVQASSRRLSTGPSGP